MYVWTAIHNISTRTGPPATNIFERQEQRVRVQEETLIEEQLSRPFAHFVPEKNLLPLVG